MSPNDKPPRDFIREVIDEDIKTNKHDGLVRTRFPPEPNGYLHIGHAKAICLNFGIAEEYGGNCNLRFDDTNPAKEEDVYVKGMIEDIKWLGYDWGDGLVFASDYYDKMYEYAVQLVKAGKAYVDDLSAEEMSEYRGSLTAPGKNSPHRERSIEENLDLLERMKAGEFVDGEKVLRAKINMAHPNMNMRDPAMYRILKVSHHRTGDKWCVYPTYDWAHGLEDSIEGITHSLCSLEFENHRPLYDWFLDELGIYHPKQIEFARLNLSYTVMSKRILLKLVEGGHVTGWDDPRLPTLVGMRRRGYSPRAIRNFCSRIGIAKVNSTVDIEFLEHCLREDLNKTASRFMGVLHPLKVVIEDYPEDEVEELDAVNNPEDPDAGSRKVPFSKVLYIEREDFMENPPGKFYRLAPGREVRLRYAYLLTCKEAIKENGDVVELRCTIDPDTRGGDAPDGRKVKSTLHWVSAAHALNAEVRLYDKLFKVENPAGQKDGDLKDYLNPDSLEVLSECRIEPALANLKPFDRFQFERLGYFCVDPDSTENKLVINRSVRLRDTWAKIQKRQQGK
jgi:glutaminyl-tRNA synthetase